MKPSASFIGWRTFLNLPARPGDYGSLVIEALPLSRPTWDSETKMPVPVFESGPSSGSKQVLALKFQCSYQREPGGQRWYGGRMELRSDGLETTSVLMRWLAKFPEEFRYSGPAEIFPRLEARAVRVAYSCELSRYVLAKDWHTAESYRCVYDVGAKSGEGCIINAYVKADATDDQITTAVAKALRASSYCSDDQFTVWMNNGRLWRKSFPTGTTSHHRPHSLTEILGEETADAVLAACF